MEAIISPATFSHCGRSSSSPALISAIKPFSKPASISWAFCIPDVSISIVLNSFPLERIRRIGPIQAAWTRRSQYEAAKRPNRKSWKQRTDMYMRPFALTVFFSRRYVHAKVVHRGTCKVVSIAGTNAKDLRYTLPSLNDYNACRTVGQLIAERCKEADVYAVAYEPRKKEKILGKLAIVIDTMKENDIIFV